MYHEEVAVAGRLPAMSLVDRLILASEAALRYRSAAYRERLGLTDGQYRILMQVANHGTVSLVQLAQLVRRDCGQVSRSVRAMVESGLLTSIRQGRGTQRAICLSEEGRSTYREMALVSDRWHDAVEDILSPAEIARAAESIARLHDAACLILAEDRPGA